MNIDKANTGMLFKNDRKIKDTDPDYKGHINIDGEQLWVNAWVNTGKSGKKYLTLRFAAKNGKHVEGGGTLTATDPSDSIPF